MSIIDHGEAAGARIRAARRPFVNNPEAIYRALGVSAEASYAEVADELASYCAGRIALTGELTVTVLDAHQAAAERLREARR